MHTQTIFNVGNSDVVAISKPIMKDLGLKRGQKVVLEKVPELKGILIVPVKEAASKSTSKVELSKWLDRVLVEDAELLDRLA